MFKKLRNRILATNMIVLSLLTIVALSLIYVVIERGVQAENQQRLTNEQSTRIVSYYGLVGMLNSDSWIFIEPPTSGQVLAMGEDSYPHVFFYDDTQSLTFYTQDNPDPTVLVATSSPAFIYYPTEVYTEAIRNFERTPDGSGSFTLNDRTWLFKRENPLFQLFGTIDLGSLSEGDSANRGFIASATFNLGDSTVLPEDIPWLAEEKREQLSPPRLALVDVTDSLASLERLSWILIASGTAIIILLFFMSFLLANRAIKPVEASWLRQKQFMSDASHELKTPLAIIRANKEVLQDNQNQTIESQSRWLDSIGAETNRMSKLVDALLILSKGDETPAELVELNVSSLTEEVCAQFEAPFFEKDLEMQSEISPDLRALVEEDSLRSAFAALFDNALRYTPEGQEVSITLAEEHKQILFTLRNTGVSLSKETLAHLFDRFWRDDQARNSSEGGFGLGLSIAQSAIQRSDGSIEASSDEDSVTITVRLKLA